jgi:hypothetical protein
MERGPIAEAYAWGQSAARGGHKPFDDQGGAATQRFMRLTTEERQAYMRGLRDEQPARAPLPLPAMLGKHALWFLLVDHAEARGGRLRDYLPLAPALAGLTRLIMDAERVIGPRRARALGVEVVRDAPRVARTWTWLGTVLTVVWVFARRALGHQPRKRSTEEITAATLANDLVEWWAWRPVVRRARSGAARRA